jgi:hypothetical protein
LLPEGREAAAHPTVVERLLDDFEALFVRTIVRQGSAASLWGVG